MLTTDRLDVDLAPLAQRAQAVLFGGYPAAPEDVALAETVRREVRRALRRHHGWAWTVASWYGYAGLWHRRARRGGRGEGAGWRDRAAQPAGKGA